MSSKYIEIYYDFRDIPGADPEKSFDRKALKFRNAAMDLIEAALEKAGQGKWVGAESGMGEVNFGFKVTDFEAAEATARQAVSDTQYACIREIARHEQADMTEFDAIAPVQGRRAPITATLPVMILLAVIFLLVSPVLYLYSFWTRLRRRA